MSSPDKIQLNSSCIFQVPIESYAEDFTFIVNGKEFKTSKLASDLLSPIICKSHSIDPTFSIYTINTSQKGDFSYFLKLFNFEPIDLPQNDLPFILEIIEKLGIKSIEHITQIKSTEITIDNAFSEILLHEKFSNIYSKNFSEEIDFISSHFFELCENKKEEFAKLRLTTLIKIFNNSKLKLIDEDQLLKFLNELYLKNSMYSILYETVFFSNLSKEAITEFINIFDLNDITNGMWLSICKRLINEKNDDEKRYKNDNKNSNIETFSYSEGNPFKGIINHLINKTSSNINEALNITASYNFYDMKNVVTYDDDIMKFFHSRNDPNSWICFDFKDHKIIPTNYSIKTDSRNQDELYHLKSWVIEGSNDSNNWEIIDEQNNCSYLNGRFNVHTFNINNKERKEFRYIRLKQTGKNWHGDDHLIFNSFEIFGDLV